jgi:hypothetical protein
MSIVFLQLLRHSEQEPFEFLAIEADHDFTVNLGDRRRSSGAVVPGLLERFS